MKLDNSEFRDFLSRNSLIFWADFSGFPRNGPILSSIAYELVIRTVRARVQKWRGKALWEGCRLWVGGSAMQLMPADKRTMVFARRAWSRLCRPAAQGPQSILRALMNSVWAVAANSCMPMATRTNVSAVGAGVGNGSLLVQAINVALHWQGPIWAAFPVLMSDRPMPGP